MHIPFFIALILAALMWQPVSAQRPEDAIIITFEGTDVGSVPDNPNRAFWSSDGKNIFMEVRGTDGPGWIRYDVADSTVTMLDGDPRIVTLSAEEMAHYRAAEPTAWISPNSRYIMYRTTYDVFVYGEGEYFIPLFALGGYATGDQSFVLLPPRFRKPILWSSDDKVVYIAADSYAETPIYYVSTETPYQTVFVDYLGSANDCLLRKVLLDLTSDGRRLLYLKDDSSSIDCILTLWHATEVTFPTGRFVIPERHEFDLEMPVGAVFIADNPDSILVADAGGISQLSMTTGEKMAIRADYDIEPVYSVIFSPDGKYALMFALGPELYLLPLK